MTLSVNISIPASHAGGDQVSLADVEQLLISIPASHAGGDSAQMVALAYMSTFQSPPPMREATFPT